MEAIRYGAEFDREADAHGRNGGCAREALARRDQDVERVDAHAPRTTNLPRGDAGSRWRLTHEKLVGLARARAGHDLEEGRWLLRASRQAVHLRLGYASFLEYVARLFGYAPRLTRDKLRVAGALEGLPACVQALETGEANWSTLRELTRVATAETEAAWLAAALGKSVREVERAVSGHSVGSRPGDAPDPEARRHVLRFEVSAEVFATFREAMLKLRREAGTSLDDDAALLLLARSVLGGPTDAGRASYQVLLRLCATCERAEQRADGDWVPIDAAALASAACDGQRLGESDATPSEPSAHVGQRRRATQSIPPAVRRFVLARDAGCCVVPGCRHATFVDVHHVRSRADGGGHDADNLVTLCSAHHAAAHRGALLVEGNGASDIGFKHADGAPYGSVRNTSVAAARIQAFRALRKLGFREADVQRALRALAPTETSVERLVRQALDVLR